MCSLMNREVEQNIDPLNPLKHTLLNQYLDGRDFAQIIFFTFL